MMMDQSTDERGSRETFEMDNEIGINPIILVVEDVHETRDGIEKLLKVDGYRVVLARDELDGIESAQRQRPDLILVSLAGLPARFLVPAVVSAKVRRQETMCRLLFSALTRSPRGLRSLLAKMYTSPSLTTSISCEVFSHSAGKDYDGRLSETNATSSRQKEEL